MGRGKNPHNLGRQLRPDWGAGRMWVVLPLLFCGSQCGASLSRANTLVSLKKKKGKSYFAHTVYIDDGRHIGKREAVLCDQGDLSRQRRLQALLQGVGGGVPAGVAAMRGLTGEFLLPPLNKGLPFFFGHRYSFML